MKINTNNIIINHSVEVTHFSRDNLRTIENRKALYDSIERDLKAIFREVTGEDLYEGYYLLFNKTEDGDWRTDLHVEIRPEERYSKEVLWDKNRNIERWVTAAESEKLFDKGIISNFPIRLSPIFSIEAECGCRQDKKSKLEVGAQCRLDHYQTNEEIFEALQSGADSSLPCLRSYSKDSYGDAGRKCSTIKIDSAYKLFKLYVASFFERIKELNAGYERVSELICPHSEYLDKLKDIQARVKAINDAKFEEMYDEPSIYRTVAIFSLENDRVCLSDVDLLSKDNIDVAAQIADLVAKLKFTKQG